MGWVGSGSLYKVGTRQVVPVPLCCPLPSCSVELQLPTIPSKILDKIYQPPLPQIQAMAWQHIFCLKHFDRISQSEREHTMGMYTGLRVRVVIKEEYRELIKEAMTSEDFGEPGKGWKQFKDKYPFLSTFADKERATSIPFGALAYMPDEWDEQDAFRQVFDEVTGLWRFQCSLKNYGSEIEEFISNVLSEIVVNSGHVESLYEENSHSELYELKDGKYQETGYGIQYYDAMQ